METRLRKVPLLLGKLKNLQVWLGGFDVGESSESSIQLLEEFNLHGELSIGNLENIMNPCDTLAANLKNKTHIVKLHLQWDLNRNIDDSMKEREVLENLQPSIHLKQLSINGYGGTEFPRWLSDNSLSNMVSLSLNNCKYCLWLPPLGLLTFLKHLYIRGFDQIARINADFYGNRCPAFACLEMLSFTNLMEWEEWECMTGAFASLHYLSVENCPKLKGHLPKQLSHLKKLTIQNVNMQSSSFDMIVPLVSHTPLTHLCIYFCPGMNIPINHCYHSLVELDIGDGCDSLTCFPLDLFPKLCTLKLRGCRNLQMISQEYPHNHFNSLTLHNCPQFESLPNEGLLADQLKTFLISGLEKLKSMPKCMPALLPSLNQLCISDCPGLEFSEGCLPSHLKGMSLANCSKLVSSLKGAWGTNPSLNFLYIYGLDLQCFPGEGFLPLSLTELFISNCPNLQKLEYRGLCHLSSLKILKLYDCPMLQCLPEEGLPESISHLEIKDCPLLKQRYKKQQGEDSEKIAHIKCIWIAPDPVKEVAN